VQIVRKESVVPYHSVKIPLTPFSRHINIFGSDYLERPVARIRIPVLFWFYYVLRQTDLALYVIEGQHEIVP